MACNPGDLGILFSLVPGMPETYAERFSNCRTWRSLYETLDELERYCERHHIPCSM